MREILFRAQDLHGVWHYGFLFRNGDKWYIACEKGESALTEINPETVGQYTGMTDKNGKMIFEDDIILYNGVSKHEVVWDDYEWNLGGFYNSFMDDPTSAFSEGTSKIEIFGNIHNNPTWRGKTNG